MADLENLAGRVERLEQQNRRLKRAGLAAAALLVAVPLGGAKLPRQVPEVVTAREIRVLDEAGTVRVFVITDGLSVFTPDGKLRTMLTTGGLVVRDADGTIRALLAPSGLGFRDADGKLRTITPSPTSFGAPACPIARPTPSRLRYVGLPSTESTKPSRGASSIGRC